MERSSFYVAGIVHNFITWITCLWSCFVEMPHCDSFLSLVHVSKLSIVDFAITCDIVLNNSGCIVAFFQAEIASMSSCVPATSRCMLKINCVCSEYNFQMDNNNRRFLTTYILYRCGNH